MIIMYKRGEWRWAIEDPIKLVIAVIDGPRSEARKIAREWREMSRKSGCAIAYCVRRVHVELWVDRA